MRVAMYYANNDVRLEEVPVPEIEPGELLMRVEASGICGSDTMGWYRIGRTPLVLGHEVAGVIERLGDGVKGLRVGDRIVAAHHVPCLACRYCLSGHQTVCDTLRKTNFFPGGFAEHLRLPQINVQRGVFPIPDGISYEEATFTEPLACVLRSQRLAGLSAGDSVLILGSGISGSLQIKAAKASGASWIAATDVSGSRLKQARAFGAHATFRTGEDIVTLVKKATDGMGADIVFVCAGADEVITQALQSVRRGGKVVFFAASGKDAKIGTTVNDIFWRTEVSLLSSYAGSPDDHVEALAWIASGRIQVKDMISHRLPLAETMKGFGLVASGGDSLKVIINPQQ